MKRTFLFLTAFFIFHLSFCQEKSSWEALKCEKVPSSNRINIRSVVLHLIINHSSDLDSIQTVFLGHKSTETDIFWFRVTKNSKLEMGYLDSISVQYLKVLLKNEDILYNKWNPWLKDDRTAFLKLRDSLLFDFREQYKDLNIKVVSDIRSRDNQRQILKKGSSLANISFHEWGLASDFAIFKKNKYQKNLKYYLLLEEYTKKYGLRWGGNFVGFVDYPHVQFYFNGAALLQKHPYLAIEYEFFYDKYIERVRQKMDENLAYEVEDTKALLAVINQLRLKEVCYYEVVLNEFLVSTPTEFDASNDLLLLLDDDLGELIVKFPNKSAVKYQKGDWK